MKTIITTIIFCAVVASALASDFVPMGSREAARMMGGGRVNEFIPMGSREAHDLISGGRNDELVPVGSREAFEMMRGGRRNNNATPMGAREAASRLLGGKINNTNDSFGMGQDDFFVGDEEDLKNHLKEMVKKAESEEKTRGEQAAAAYDKLAEERIKKYVFEPSSTFSECIKKIGMHIVEANSLKDAGALAKKQASEDSDYIVKQIELSKALSTWQISTTPPYYLDDPMIYDFEIYDFPEIKYKKNIITKYPKEGISTKRNYKFITLSKTITNKEIKFEEGEVIFVQKGLDLNVKMNQLRCVTMGGNIPEDVVKKVIKQHNKKLPNEVKKAIKETKIGEE